MKRTYRTVALVIGSALIATAAISCGTGSEADARGEGAQEEDLQATHETDSRDPREVGQGETLAESRQYETAQEEAARPPQWAAIDAHNEAGRGPIQPIPFSHRFHVTDLQIDCMYCHAGTERSATGVVPALEVCMGCHRVAGTGLPPIEELRGYAQRGEPIPWKWVNKLPEFVQFTHRPHLRTGIECAECHGPVEEMDRVYQWAPLTMGWCLECHRQPPRDTDVATDHTLAERFPPPALPAERQEGSLYPLSIDTEYADWRGPIDCAACHY